MSVIYRVRDKTTGKWWNGSYRRSVFDDKGHAWKKKASVENTISHFVRYRSKFKIQTAHSLPESWEIVEMELIEREKESQSIGELLRFTLLKNEVEKQNAKMGVFLEIMRNKGVLDQIEYLILLRPTDGNTYNYVSMDGIKEARAHLRQLGVKTRTFRESGGVFGMMDRQQALKARMVLDIEDSLDLGTLRKTLGF